MDDLTQTHDEVVVEATADIAPQTPIRTADIDTHASVADVAIAAANVAAASTVASRLDQPIDETASDVAAVATWSVLVAGLPGDRTMLIVDWLMLACRELGMIAHAVSLGERRGGVHGMFIEIAAAGDVEAEDVFCGLPAGPASVIIAGEHLELARALEQGWSGPDTTIIASTRRVMTDVERVAAPAHVIREQEIDRLAASSSGAYIAFDAPLVASWYSLPAASQPSLLFGALAAADVLPITTDACLHAIAALGIDPRTHTQGFTRGVPRGRRTGGRVVRSLTAEQFVRKRRGGLPRGVRADFEQLIMGSEHRVRPGAQPALRIGIEQCCEHSGSASAAALVELVSRANTAIERAAASDRDVADADVDALVADVARHVTGMLAYPDAAWAATVRLRRQRLQQVRSRHEISRNEAYRVTDLIAVDARDAASAGLFGRRSAATEADGPGALDGAGAARVERIDATTVRGALRLRRLRAAGRHREGSARSAAAVECAEMYVAAVVESAAAGMDIVELVVRSGSIVEGSGAARDATTTAAMAFWGRVVRQALAIDRNSGTDSWAVSRAVIPAVCTDLVQSGPLALWEYTGKVVGIAMHMSRGGTYADAVRFAQAL